MEIPRLGQTTDRFTVLLRVLEYYRGILILTTNRIRSFDIAVQSRINLAIKFEDLTEKQKKRIFRNLVNQLGDEQVKNKQALLDWMNDDDDASRSFSKLNGRQVRNVVFSAASLAGNRKPGDNLLKREDIQRMLNETVEFQKHLHELTRAAREKNEV
jgi:AAA+ superfamily predicted ATPase